VLKSEEYFEIEKIAFEEIKCSDWNISHRFCFFQQWKEERIIKKNATSCFRKRSNKGTIPILSSCLSLVQKTLVD